MLTRFSFSRLTLILMTAFAASSQAILASICDEWTVQLGWFASKQGKKHHVDIDGLIGDDFSARQSSDQNFLAGIGYYFYEMDLAQSRVLYGINAFYFAPAKVKGKVTQEDLYTNLSYRYSRTNYPVYFAARALIACNPCYDLTIDLGIGPNFIRTNRFKERSLDGGITDPDPDIFTKKNTVAFSAAAGFGLRVNNAFGNHAIEINYRFFYLGESELKKNNNQLRNTLRTGHSYANALFFTISI